MPDPVVRPEAPHDELYALRVQHSHDVEALAAAADRIDGLIARNSRLEDEIVILTLSARHDSRA